jgi:hypothetical protein
MRGGVEELLLFLDWYGLAMLHVSHEGLRAVAACHSDRIRRGHRVDREAPQVVARAELDRLDPAPTRLLGEMKALDLPATRSWVHKEHRPGASGVTGWSRRPTGRRRPAAMTPSTGAAGGDGEERDRAQEDRHALAGVAEIEGRGRRGDREHGRSHSGDAGGA